MATRNFTLHHHIARPISLHHHKPAADLFQNAGLVGSFAFTGVLIYLLWLAATSLKGAPLSVLLAVILPLKVAIILLGFFIYYRTTFRRNLDYLRRKFTPKIEHAFKHK